jgi:hypothetical protein
MQFVPIFFFRYIDRYAEREKKLLQNKSKQVILKETFMTAKSDNYNYIIFQNLQNYTIFES